MEEKLVHAYLITSASPEVRERMAQELAQRMLCEGEEPRPCGECRHCRKVKGGIHPDVVLVERDRDEKGQLKREFSVVRMREMIADAWIRPNEAQRKVYIIRDAQTLNSSAQNAILKLLEEPPGSACFILCADNAAALLDTVRSRCVERSENSRERPDYDRETLEQVEKYLGLAAREDLPELLRLLAEWEKLDTEQARKRISALGDRLGEMLCLRQGNMGMGRQRIADLLALAEKAETYQRANVSTKHIMGLLSVDTVRPQGK